ncbi:MAG: hypothetical protein IPG71_04250 [bacterium]|nr:hypothetical protein [bacterium]
MRLLTILLLGIFLIPQFGYAIGGSTCAQATVVGALPYSDGGQLESGVNPNCPGEPVNDLFYVFTAPQTGIFHFDMCGSNSCCDQQMSIWGNGLCCSGSAVIINSGCTDGYPLRELYMLAGQTIYIEIGKSIPEWAIAPLYQFNVSLVSDFCPGTDIPALPFLHTGTTEYATQQYSSSCDIFSSRDVVFRYTATDSVLVRAAVHASWQSALQVRKNNCETGAAFLCYYDEFFLDSSWFAFWTEPDSTYYFIVDGAGLFAWGNYTFTLQEISPVLNDFCPGTLIQALPYTDSGSTLNATHQYTGSCYTQTAPDVVYSFTPTSGTILVASLNSDWPECMQVRTNNCETGASLDCRCLLNVTGSHLYFWGEPDSTYYLILDGVYQYFSSGSYTFTLQEASGPSDICPGTEISSLPFASSGSTSAAYHQYGGSCYSHSAPDVVFRFTPTSEDSMYVRASLTAYFYNCLQVRKNNCETGTSLLCDCRDGGVDSWGFDFWTEPDSTYYFIIDGEADTFSSGYFSFALEDFSFDVCPGTLIPSLPFADSGSTEYANHDYSGGCFSGTEPDVVYEFTSPDSMLLVATVNAIWADALKIRKNNCETESSLLCDNGFHGDSSRIVFWAEPDSTFYFIVGGTSTNDFTCPYTFTLQEHPPVQNDLCPGTLIPSVPYTDNGSTVFASNQSSLCNSYSANDVVYQYSPSESLIVQVSLGSWWSNSLALRVNDCVSGASPYCDNGFVTDSASFAFWAAPNNTYYFFVDGYFTTSNYGDYTITLQEATAVSDTCPGAVIPSLPFTDVNNTEAFASQFNGDCYLGSAPDMLYRFTATSAVLLQASVTTPGDDFWSACLQLRTNCATVASPICVCGGLDGASFSFLTEPDSTYYFVVDGFTIAESGPYTFTLTSLSCPAPDSLVIAASGNDIVLLWPHVDCDTPTYKVYRSTTLDVPIEPANLIGTTPDSTYTDTGILLTQDITNFYVVKAE